MSAPYYPSPTAQRMHADDMSRIKVMMSAIGTGKTVAMLHELFSRSLKQEPNADGIRQTRWVVIRSTYSQLKSTTISTFLRWFGHICTIVYDSPIKATMHFKLKDGTTLHVEWLFMSLDSDDAIDRLLSLEVTGAGINELAEIRARSILKNVLSRCARYPGKEEGASCTWHGIVADMNPPPIGSWLYDLFEKDKTPGHELYRYPPPIFIERDPDFPDDTTKIEYIPNPEAENWQNQQLGYDYWIELAKMNIGDWDWITRMILGDYPFGGGGRPVYPTFSHQRHVRPSVTHMPGSYLLIGMDFGFKPAAAICQFNNGRVNLLDEIVTEDCSLVEFLEDHLLPLLRAEYPHYRYIVCGDPSGDETTSTIDRATSYRTLKKYNLKVYKPLTNRFKPRREAVLELFRRHDGFAAHPQCKTFIGGAASGYCWKETKGTSPTMLRPDKTNIYSHVHDAFQCVALYLKNGGEVYDMNGPKQRNDYDYIEEPERQSTRGGFLYA